MSRTDEPKLFNSKTDPIPEIRKDLQIIPVKDNGQTYIYFHDSMGYTIPNFALESNVGAILNLIDGRRSIRDLSPYLGKGITTDQLLTYIQFLDKNRILYSDHFREYARQMEQDYERAPIHRSTTAGLSYPADADSLREFLDEAFSGKEMPKQTTGLKGLYAPHIDPRVGIDTYAGAFSAIRRLRPKRIVILATSHYAGLHSELYQDKPFIISSKDFELPLGTVLTDKQAVRELLESTTAKGNGSDTGLTGHDRAHRMEHSIELHLLFLKSLWDHEFRIIPILVGSLEELFYMRDGHQAKQVESFSRLLHSKFGRDDETFFLISGDLAHIGKKFGDKQAARTMFEQVKAYDRAFLEHARNSEIDKLLNLVGKNYDPYRICGYPPLYTFLKCMPGLKGEVLNYDIWDEQERESAVTFGSILYKMKNEK